MYACVLSQSIKLPVLQAPAEPTEIVKARARAILAWVVQHHYTFPAVPGRGMPAGSFVEKTVRHLFGDTPVRPLLRYVCTRMPWRMLPGTVADSVGGQRQGVGEERNQSDTAKLRV